MDFSADTIFFDVDGTLVDARKDIVRAMNHALKMLGRPERPFEEIVSYIGTGVKDLVRKSLGKENSSLVDKGTAIFADYYTAHPTDESVLYPHVKETLEHFKDKRKFIISNRYEAFADVALDNFGIRDYFEAILGGDDEDCLKPSACVLERAFSKYNIDRRKAIIVGDMAIDVETGRNSGIKTCWVTYGLGKRADLKGLRPDFTIDDIAELKKIVV